MNIAKVRLGLATNSSSSHSLIFLDGISDDHMATDRDFGWGFFTAASEESKGDYLSLTLFNNLRDIFNDKVARLVVKEVTGLDIESTTAYIDHQSVLALPTNWKGDYFDEEFFADFKKYMLREDLVILGGNDNSDESHPLTDQGQAFRLPLETDFHNDDVIARKDGIWWVIFNRKTGGKVKFSFEDTKEEYTKSSSPELVDLKITNWCDKGCEFCLVPETMILTPDGEVAIKDIKINDIVYGYNNKEEKRVELVTEQIFERDYEGDLIVIEAEDGSEIKLTPNHEVYTLNRGWIKAENIEENDHILKF